MLADSDNLSAFAPLTQIVGDARLRTLLGAFDRGVQNGSLNGVTQLQAKFLRQWLTDDSIGSIEVVQRGSGFVSPAASKSYVTVLGALLVCIHSLTTRIFSADADRP